MTDNSSTLCYHQTVSLNNMAASLSIVPFETATAVSQLASHSWRANLVQDYCVGAVPNGGYVASVIYRAVARHLSSLCLRQQIISAQLQYANRTQIGEATIVIEEVKKGRATSIFHATLLQDLQALKPRKCILAYFVCSAPSETGLTLTTDWELLPSLPRIDLKRVVKGLDPNWSSEASRVQISHLASLGFVRAVEGVYESYYRKEPERKGLEDSWIRLSSGERFTDATLPLVADAKPYVVEGWRPLPAEKSNKQKAGPFSRNDPFWYPTLAMNLDIKKSLPPNGVEWLFIRTEARKIDQGRLDLQVIILDQDGELVALASHVNMILSASRNIGVKGAKHSKGRL